MAYYTKKEVIDKIDATLKEIADNNGNLLTKPEDATKSLSDEKDIVSLGWSEKKILENNAEGVEVKSQIFIRIAGDLYTDDTYAIDLYMSMVQGKSVESVIKNNMKLRMKK